MMASRKKTLLSAVLAAVLMVSACAMYDARQAIRQGDYAKAETVTRSQLADDPNNGLLRSDLGLALLYQGRDQEAVAELEQAKADSQKWQPVYWHSVAACLHTGEMVGPLGGEPLAVRIDTVAGRQLVRKTKALIVEIKDRRQLLDRLRHELEEAAMLAHKRRKGGGSPR